jgi:Peptidase M15
MNKSGREPISKHFMWREALWLPQWQREATEEDGVNEYIRENLEELFTKMDMIRNFFLKPIIVHCAYRPKAYNELVGGALRSAHMDGRAVDFHVMGLNCDEARKTIIDLKLLDLWKVRLENNAGKNWLHVDLRLPGSGGRFFKP